MRFVNYFWIQECFPGQDGPIDREVREPSLELTEDLHWQRE